MGPLSIINSDLLSSNLEHPLDERVNNDLRLPTASFSSGNQTPGFVPPDNMHLSIEVILSISLQQNLICLRVKKEMSLSVFYNSGNVLWND